MLKVISGPMKSRKSGTLIDIISDYLLMGKQIKVFYPAHVEKKREYIISRNGNESKAISIFEPKELFQHIDSKIDAIIIDEVQFMDNNVEDNLKDFLSFVEYCSINKIDLICAGLDLNFKEEPFQIMGLLFSFADEIIKLKSICDLCKSPNANRTLRFTNDKPSKLNENILILEGGNITYYTCCKDCYNSLYKS